MTLNDQELGFVNGVTACASAANLEAKLWLTASELMTDEERAAALKVTSAFIHFAQKIEQELAASLRDAKGSNNPKDMS